MAKVIIGVDPHKLSATIKVVDQHEKLLGSGRFRTDQARSFPAAMASRIVSSRPYSFKIAPMSRSSVMTKPSKPMSSRSNCVTTREDNDAGTFFSSKHGYQP